MITAENNGLDFIDPPTAALSIDGVQITVTPVTVGQLRKLLALVQPVLSDLALMDVEGIELALRSMNADTDKLSMVPHCEELIDFVVCNAERVTAALALCTGQPAAWIDGLLLDRYLAVLVPVIRVNHDFFVSALPSLNAQVGLLNGIGAPTTASTATPAPSLG